MAQDLNNLALRASKRTGQTKKQREQALETLRKALWQTLSEQGRDLNEPIYEEAINCFCGNIDFYHPTEGLLKGSVLNWVEKISINCNNNQA